MAQAQSMNSEIAAPGLLLWSDIDPPDLIELTELADSTGYSELWYTDIRYYRDCYVGLTLAALHSKNLTLGPGVSDPYSRHPGHLAMAAATLDELTGGRSFIGLGSGTRLESMGVHQNRPLRGLREAIDIIRQVLAGGRVNYEGEIFQLRDSLGFEPLRRAIPVFIATHSPRTLRLASQIADGILLANLARRSSLEEALTIVRTAERDSGRGVGDVAVHLRLETCISENEAIALDTLRHRLAIRLCASYPKWDYLPGLGISVTDSLRSAAEADNVSAVQSLLRDEHVRASTLVGSPDSIARQLNELLCPGVSKVTIRPMTVAGGTIKATVRQFIEDVWPRVTPATLESANRPQ